MCSAALCALRKAPVVISILVGLICSTMHIYVFCFRLSVEPNDDNGNKKNLIYLTRDFLLLLLWLLLLLH